MSLTLEAVIAAVADRVGRSRGKLKQPIGPDTKMFQDGLIDSFGLVELQADLEKLFGKALSEGELMPDDFESPRVLHARLKELLG
jgi:acyl carrier protein